MATDLDVALKQIEDANSVAAIPAILNEAFAKSEPLREATALLGSLADEVRKNDSTGQATLNFYYALRKMPYAARTAFLNAPANKDIRKKYESDPKGMEAAKKLAMIARQKGAEIAESVGLGAATQKILSEEMEPLEKELINLKRSVSKARNEIFWRSFKLCDKYEKKDKELQRAKMLWNNAAIQKRKEEIKRRVKDEVMRDYPDLESEEKQLDELEREAQDGRYTLVQPVVEKILARSTISETEAQDWVKKNISVDKYVAEEFGEEKAKYFLDEIAKVYRICNGRLDGFTLKHENTRRSYANDKDRILALADSLKKATEADIRRTIWHEVGHFIEFFNPDIGKAATEFIKMRAKGPLTKLADVNPDSGFGDDELFYPDDFIADYMGKVYNAGTSTEVVSMAMDVLSGGMYAYGVKDADHLGFVLSILDTVDNDSKARIDAQIPAEKQLSGKEAEEEKEARRKDFIAAIDAVLTKTAIGKLYGWYGIDDWKVKAYGDFKGHNYGDILYKKKFYSGRYDEDDAYRVAYCLICADRGLFPDGERIVKKFKITKLDPPDWFFAGMKLPRIKLK